jgi:hypothetical protein
MKRKSHRKRNESQWGGRRQRRGEEEGSHDLDSFRGICRTTAYVSLRRFHSVLDFLLPHPGPILSRRISNKPTPSSCLSSLLSENTSKLRLEQPQLLDFPSYLLVRVTSTPLDVDSPRLTFLHMISEVIFAKLGLLVKQQLT